MIEHLKHRVYGAGLWILRAVNQAPNASVRNGSSAHYTGLHRYVHVTFKEAVVTHGLPGFSKCKDLCVGSGIVGAERTVTSAAYDSPVAYDHRSDGDFALRERTQRLA